MNLKECLTKIMIKAQPLVVTVAVMLILLLTILLIPSKDYEIHVGDNMEFETKLIEEIEEQLEILKQQQ